MRNGLKGKLKESLASGWDSGKVRTKQTAAAGLYSRCNRPCSSVSLPKVRGDVVVVAAADLALLSPSRL
jgi:hypothetical protein